MKSNLKSDAEEVVTKSTQDEPKKSAPKTGKKNSKTKETKTVKKTAKKVVKKAKKAYEVVLGHVLGSYRASSHKGKIAAEAQAKGSITEQSAQKLAGKGVNAQSILYRIRRRGKKTGWWVFFPSTKVEGKWILKVKNSKAAHATKAKPAAKAA